MEQTGKQVNDDLHRLLCTAYDADDAIPAVLKIPAGKYNNDDCIEKTIGYAASHPIKDGLYGAGCSPEPDRAMDEFHYVKHLYGKEKGKQIHHFIIAFKQCSAVNPHTLPLIASDIANYFYGSFQAYYGIHVLYGVDGVPYYHIHIFINTINYATGLKYHPSIAEKRKFIRYIESLPHGIRITEADRRY